MTLVITGPSMAVFFFSFRIILGRRVCAGILARRKQLLRLMAYFTTLTSLCFVYPAYQIITHAATGTRYELPLILLLPVIKLVVQNIIARTIDNVDMIP